MHVPLRETLKVGYLLEPRELIPDSNFKDNHIFSAFYMAFAQLTFNLAQIEFDWLFYDEAGKVKIPILETLGCIPVSLLEF